MATETATAADVSTEAGNWQAGVAGGLVGGIVFGAMMSMMTPGVLEMGIPAMYGIEGPAGAIGWAIHMSHGAVIGLGFGAIAGLKPDVSESIGTSLGVGAGYGLLVWVALAVIVMPIWLSTVGFPRCAAAPEHRRREPRWPRRLRRRPRRRLHHDHELIPPFTRFVTPAF